MVGSILNGLQIGAGTTEYTYSTTNTVTTTDHVLYTVPANAYADVIVCYATINITGASISGSDVSLRINSAAALTSILATNTSTAVGFYTLGFTQISSFGAVPYVLKMVAGDILSLRHTSAGGAGGRSLAAYVKLIEYTT